WLWLASSDAGFDKLSLLSPLLNVYYAAVAELKRRGVSWLQLDEPILALDLPATWLTAYHTVYRELAPVAPPILLATYFGDVGAHAALLESLPVAGLHLDLIRAPGQLDIFLSKNTYDKILSLGVVDGRNLWRSDLASVLAVLHPAKARLGDRLWVSASCSLLHVPHDLVPEGRLDPRIRNWMAFARQKLDEL